MTLEEETELSEARKRLAELEAKAGFAVGPPTGPQFKPAGSTDASRAVSAPAAPKPQTDAEKFEALEKRVATLEGNWTGLKREIWDEWGKVQDAARSEFKRIKNHITELITKLSGGKQ